MQLSLSPQKVQVLRADAEDAEIEHIIGSPSVEIDVDRRAVKVTAPDEVEEASIQGDLIASARGVKITCNSDGDERRSLHLTFARPEELDAAVAKLEQGGLAVVRSGDDPDYRRGA